MGSRATLTRGGPHAGRPELPQDEALLALSQGQEELIGFYALLTETQAWAASAVANTGALHHRATPTCSRPASPPRCPVSAETPWTEPRTALLSCAPPPPFHCKLASRKIQDPMHVGEASLLPCARCATRARSCSLRCWHPCCTRLACATKRIWQKGWHVTFSTGLLKHCDFHLRHSLPALSLVRRPLWRRPCQEDTQAAPREAHGVRS